MVARFAEADWTVAGCGRDAAAIDELRRQYPGPHRFDVVDVTDDASVGAWAAGLAEQGLFPISC